MTLPLASAVSFEVALASFLVKLAALINEGRSPLLQSTLTVSPGGTKFVRVLKSEGTFGGSAYCFVERETGNILKPAGFKGPAKGTRGNIYNENQIQGCGPYGVAHLR